MVETPGENFKPRLRLRQKGCCSPAVSQQGIPSSLQVPIETKHRKKCALEVQSQLLLGGRGTCIWSLVSNLHLALLPSCFSSGLHQDIGILFSVLFFRLPHSNEARSDSCPQRLGPGLRDHPQRSSAADQGGDHIAPCGRHHWAIAGAVLEPGLKAQILPDTDL